MTRTTKLILVTIFAIVVIVAIILILRAPRPGAKVNANRELQTENREPSTAPPPTVIPPPRLLTSEEQAVENDKAVGRKTSLVFAERFGSYSNQGLFLNISDLYPLMTAAMKSWADNFRREAGSKQPNQGYAGVTTRALTAAIDEYLGSEGKMRVVVGTQREERSDATRKVYTQDLTVHVVKDAGVWKVNSILWGEQR